MRNLANDISHDWHLFNGQRHFERRTIHHSLILLPYISQVILAILANDSWSRLLIQPLDTCGQCYKTFFPSSLMMRPNKLEGLSLETLSSQVLEFEGKARATPIGVPFRCFLLGLLVLSANVRLDWKVIAISLFGLVISNEGNFFITLTSGGNDRE